MFGQWKSCCPIVCRRNCQLDGRKVFHGITNVSQGQHPPPNIGNQNKNPAHAERGLLIHTLSIQNCANGRIGCTDSLCNLCYLAVEHRYHILTKPEFSAVIVSCTCIEIYEYVAFLKPQ